MYHFNCLQHFERQVMRLLAIALYASLVGEEISVVQQQYFPWQDIF